MVISSGFIATLYSLCGVSRALKFKAFAPRCHCKGESLYGDRAVELQPSGSGALTSAWCAFRTRSEEPVSTPASPRLLSVTDSCLSLPLPSMFSIKKDDALDEVGVPLSLSFSCMFCPRFHAAFTQKPSESWFICALRQPTVQTFISSDAAFAPGSDMESLQGRGSPRCQREERETEAVIQWDVKWTLHEPKASSDWTSTIANGVFRGKDNYCRPSGVCVFVCASACACVHIPSRPCSQERKPLFVVQHSLFRSIKLQIKIKIH